MSRAAAAALLVACACGEDPRTVVFVTIDRRPTVHEVTRLRVAVRNEGAERAQEFPVAPHAFPLSLTVTPTGRTGDLELSVSALDADGALVARGARTVTIVPNERVDLDLVLDPEDFVLNGMAARTQWLTVRMELAGRQLAVRPDGAWMVAWENDCPLSRCDILGRLFDGTTRPATNATNLNDLEFIVNQTTEFTISPAVAAGPEGFLVAWIGEMGHVKATALTADGGHRAPTDTLVSADPAAERSPVAIGRPDGSWVVAWERPRAAPATGTDVRVRLLSPDATPLANGVTGDASDYSLSSALAGTATLPHLAPFPSGGFVATWTYQNEGETLTNIRARIYGGTGAPTSQFDIPVTSYSTGSADLPHVAVLSDDAFVLAWWRDAGEQQPLLLQRFDGSGKATGPAIEIVADTETFWPAPALAARRDGAGLGVAWADCGASGDGQGCGIRFRLFHASGLPVGEDVVVNTTIAGDQQAPSLAALGGDAFLVVWTDGSMAPPDTDGNGLRGRVIYPPLDRRDGAVGARCTLGDPTSCGADLACSDVDSPGQPLCHPTCAAPDDTPCPGGGLCRDGVCLFF